MSRNLIIVTAGAKQSGKTTACRYILSEYLNYTDKVYRGFGRYSISESGQLYDISIGEPIELDVPNAETDVFWRRHGAKIYSFADLLKQFLISVFDVKPRQCYGTDEEKASYVNVRWEDMPDEIRVKNQYRRTTKAKGLARVASGPMTARELMQVFGTDICRRMDTNCWSRALYDLIDRESSEIRLALVSDCRFPNEVGMGSERGAMVIRLTRQIEKDPHPSETALNAMPGGEFSLTVDNQHMSQDEKNAAIKPHIRRWMNHANIIGP